MTFGFFILVKYCNIYRMESTLQPTLQFIFRRCHEEVSYMLFSPLPFLESRQGLVTGGSEMERLRFSFFIYTPKASAMVLNFVQNTGIPFVWFPVLHFTFIRYKFVSTDEQEEKMFSKMSYFSDLILRSYISSAFCFYQELLKL